MEVGAWLQAEAGGSDGDCDCGRATARTIAARLQPPTNRNRNQSQKANGPGQAEAVRSSCSFVHAGRSLAERSRKAQQDAAAVAATATAATPTAQASIVRRTFYSILFCAAARVLACTNVCEQHACMCVCVVCTHFVIYGPRVFYSICVAFFLAEGGIEIVFRNTRKCLLNFPHLPSLLLFFCLWVVRGVCGWCCYEELSVHCCCLAWK